MDAIYPRRLRRWGLLRIAVASLGVAWLVLLAAVAYAAVLVSPTLSGLVAVVAAALIAAGGFLYAWREPGR